MVKTSQILSDNGFMKMVNVKSGLFVSLNSFRVFSKLSGGELRTTHKDADL